MSIEIRRLSKTFPNGFNAVDDVSFKMETGSLVAVLGARAAPARARFCSRMIVTPKCRMRVTFY